MRGRPVDKDVAFVPLTASPGDESTMSVPRPHFFLYSESRTPGNIASTSGRWRFVLEAADGASQLEAEDDEPDGNCDRLALLAVVRGLEALDQPSHVTLVTGSRYVARGLRFGLRELREHAWCGESGEVRESAVPNGDLWWRVDRALQFHEVRCRAVGGAGEVDQPTTAGWPRLRRPADAGLRTGPRRRWSSVVRRGLQRCGRWLSEKTARIFSSPSHAHC
jgi:hypothetical protein